MTKKTNQPPEPKHAITVLTDEELKGLDWSTMRLQDMVNGRGKVRHYADKLEKPCHALGYCPYGYLVEFFQIQEDRDQYSCDVFGHDCPVFYLAEGATERKKNNQTYETLADRIEDFIDMQEPSFSDAVAALEIVRLRTYMSVMIPEDKGEEE